ncbi:MAG: hypothetical protein PWR24_1717 [Desulfonauticus sp.]|jgi:protein-tyrosine phosphatase|nr:hypothetical protein [Desulfonauticus sp.]
MNWKKLLKFFKPNFRIEYIKWLTPYIAVGPAPFSNYHLNLLKEHKIKAILNLCAECPNLVEVEQKHGFEVYFLPVEDEKTPSLETLEQALSWLEKNVFIGKKTYIHCRFGIGRTGTLLAAYLARRGVKPKKIEEIISKLRATPESTSQKDFLSSYQKQQGALKNLHPSLSLDCELDCFSTFELLNKKYTKLYLSSLTPNQKYCGKEHNICCFQNLQINFLEAYYLQFNFNIMLDLTLREKILKTIKKKNTRICPLYIKKCVLFDFRPSACRRLEVKDKKLFLEVEKEIEELNENFLKEKFNLENYPEKFTYPEVISGKYIQKFFNFLTQNLKRK